MSGAYSGFDHRRIEQTVRLLRYYRNFIRSECEAAIDPFSPVQGTMNKAQAQARLTKMVHIAINRKAGIPAVQFKKAGEMYQIAMMRDQQALHNRIRKRIRIYQFETAEVKRRYAHLLDKWGEDGW